MNFFFSEYRNFRRGAFSVSLISVIGKINTQKVYITILWRKLQPHATEKFRRGNLLCFRKFLVWNKFMNNRGCHFIPSKTFSLTVPQSFMRERFCVSEKSGMEKIMQKRGVSKFLSTFFCLTCRKILWVNTFVF